MEAVSGGDRRIDRVLDPGFVAGVEQLRLEELRDRREQAEEEEADISYLRRLLQGRLDIVRAELERRASGGDPGELMERLPSILAGPQVGASGRLQHLRDPGRAEQYRRRVERLVSDDTVARLPELDAGELERAAEQLTAEEARVSATRRRLHEVVDRLRGELTRRYRSGDADVAVLLEREPTDRGDPA